MWMKEAISVKMKIMKKTICLENMGQFQCIKCSCFGIIRKVKPKVSKKDRKYPYAINSTRAFHNIRIFLKRKKGGQRPPDIDTIIANEIESIRPGRSDPRKVRQQYPVCFFYRFQ